MQSQIDRWALLHPTAPRGGKMFEIPPSYLVPRIGAVIGVAGILWWANQQFFWVQKPETMNPEFIEEAKRIGNVAQRMNAPPVFLNPFRHRIPGNIVGPEDLKKELD